MQFLNGLEMLVEPLRPISHSNYRYGIKRVMIAGGVACSAGLLVSSWVTSLVGLYFTYGVLIGAAGRCVVIA